MKIRPLPCPLWTLVEVDHISFVMHLYDQGLKISVHIYIQQCHYVSKSLTITSCKGHFSYINRTARHKTPQYDIIRFQVSRFLQLAVYISHTVDKSSPPFSWLPFSFITYQCLIIRLVMNLIPCTDIKLMSQYGIKWIRHPEPDSNLVQLLLTLVKYKNT